MPKGYRILALLLLVSLFFAAFSTQPTFASGLRTNTDANSGQVRVVQDGETRYLSTQTNGTGNTATSGATTNQNRTNGQNPQNTFFNFRIDQTTLPLGFFSDPGVLITNLINIAFIVAVLLAFFFLITAGFDWITSGGDRGKIEGARGKIINVVIGLIVVAASYAILTLVLQLLGYGSFNELLTETQQNILR